MANELVSATRSLLAPGKGILAADETPRTLSRRFEALGIGCTEASRCAYREMLFTAPGAAEFISGVILQDETIRQTGSRGLRLTQVLADQGVMPGIKVDTGAKSLAGWPGELVTEGLDGLRERLAEYRELGAGFAKWRAVFRVAADRPSDACIAANAHALARYAQLCQEQGLLPIVEPEVLMEGDHGIGRSERVTDQALQAVFDALYGQGVVLETMLLKPNMVISGQACARQASVESVAQATLRCLRRRVPSAVPGIVFLSGGQEERRATQHLDAINRIPGPHPWTISFSYGRALQDPALRAWGGRPENLDAGQSALLLRARCNAAAALGRYAPELEFAGAPAPGPAPPQAAGETAEVGVHGGEDDGNVGAQRPGLIG